MEKRRNIKIAVYYAIMMEYFFLQFKRQEVCEMDKILLLAIQKVIVTFIVLTTHNCQRMSEFFTVMSTFSDDT